MLLPVGDEGTSPPWCELQKGAFATIFRALKHAPFCPPLHQPEAWNSAYEQIMRMIEAKKSNWGFIKFIFSAGEGEGLVQGPKPHNRSSSGSMQSGDRVREHDGLRFWVRLTTHHFTIRLLRTRSSSVYTPTVYSVC